MGRIGLIAIALVMVVVPFARAEELVIVRDGKSDFVIVTPENPAPRIMFAARELARYVKQMSGADLPIERGTNPARGIFLDPITKSMSPGSVSADYYEILLGPAGIHLRGFGEGPPLYAVYLLLDRLGCRFLAPQLSQYQGAGEIIPSNPNITIEQNQVSSRPRLGFRKIYVEEGHSHTPENLAQIVEWMPKVGYNTLVVPADYQGNHRVMWDNFRDRVTPECQKRGITIEVGGHGYQNFLNAEMEGGKLFEKHPDWFGMNAAGMRQKTRGWVPCTSNPQAVDYLIDNFIAYVKARPEIQIYDFWPPDGAKWCECEQCKKLGSPSDRQAILIRQVKERVKSVRPDLRLEVLAYHTSVYPPEKEKLDKEVLLDFCPINQQFDHPIDDLSAEKNADYVKGLLAWRKAFDGDISIYSYYRKYAWDSLPVIIPHYMQKDLQWYAKVPVQGVSTYAEPGDWCTYELNHYVLAALAWDPDADVDAIVKKFCAARYGKFADQARTALMTLEDVTRKTSSIPNTSLKTESAISVDCGRAAKLGAGVAAAAKIADDPAVERSLERLVLMCEYVKRDLEVQKLRASGASKDDVAAKADELHVFLTQHAEDGVFLVKDQRISPQRMQRRYGAGATTRRAGG